MYFVVKFEKTKSTMLVNDRVMLIFKNHFIRRTPHKINHDKIN